MKEYIATPAIAMHVPIPVCVEILLPVRNKLLNNFCKDDVYMKASKQKEDEHLPKTMIEKPMTKTRFKTLPTACVRGATLSRVLVAIWEFKRQKLIWSWPY